MEGLEVEEALLVLKCGMNFTYISARRLVQVLHNVRIHRNGRSDWVSRLLGDCRVL